MQGTLCTARSIDASPCCMLALTNQGRLLLNKNTPAPQRIDSPDAFKPLFGAVRTVSAGHAHWGAVMHGGEICMQGEGTDGQLGNGGTESVEGWQHFVLLYKVKAVSIACGGAHSLVLDELGRYFQALVGSWQP